MRLTLELPISVTRSHQLSAGCSSAMTSADYKTQLKFEEVTSTSHRGCSTLYGLCKRNTISGGTKRDDSWIYFGMTTVRHLWRDYAQTFRTWSVVFLSINLCRVWCQRECSALTAYWRGDQLARIPCWSIGMPLLCSPTWRILCTLPPNITVCIPTLDHRRQAYSR